MTYKDIHAHLAPGGVDAPEGVLVSLTPDEARRVLSRPGLRGHFTVGIHPWDTVRPVDWDEFTRFLDHPAVVGVGECGLDKLRGAPLPVQEEILVRQLRLAADRNLPVILHIVKAFDILLRLRGQFQSSAPWIVHGFRGNPQLAQQLLRAGIDISIGPRYNPATLAVIPPSRLYRESDAPVSAETNFWGS